MRLIFVYWKIEDAGSAQTICNYARVARELGHELALYAPEGSVSRIPCSLDIERADAAIFVLEWNIYLHNNEPLDIEGPLSRMPRERRVVLDCDGMYNDVIRVRDDYNHIDEAASVARTKLYDSISDEILQPTYHPLRPNVGTFLFHAYNPDWEVPLDFSSKEYGMLYVGTNWFRWRAMKRVLEGIRPIRKQIGRIGIVGHNWSEAPGGADAALREVAYSTEPEFLKMMGVELMPPVPIEKVIPTMSRSVFNPVLIRPLFSHLGLVTVRTFETPAANTIPLFDQNPAYVREIYGEDAVELVLPENHAEEKILEIISKPYDYAKIVMGIRKHLAENHSFTARLQQLTHMVKS